jgi:hypothetical protein
MEESIKKGVSEGGDKEILYSRAIKAGRRIYYLDVKKNLRNDLFLAITESKRVQLREGVSSSFEKHKIFLYKEDFDKFVIGLKDVIDFVKNNNESSTSQRIIHSENLKDEADEAGEEEELTFNIDF